MVKDMLPEGNADEALEAGSVITFEDYIGKLLAGDS